MLQCNCGEPEQNKLNQMNFKQYKDEDVHGKVFLFFSAQLFLNGMGQEMIITIKFLGLF